MILRFATREYDIYQPLLRPATAWDASSDTSSISMRMKLILSRTSLEIKQLSAPFLYESLQLSIEGVRKINRLLREGRIKACYIKRLVLSHRTPKKRSPSLEHALGSVTDLLKACTHLQFLDLSSFDVRRPKTAEEVNIASSSEIWDAIPNKIQGIALCSPRQMHYLVKDRVERLQEFLQKHTSLMHWDIGDIHSLDTLPPPLELVSRVESLSMRSRRSRDSQAETPWTLCSVTRLEVHRSALEGTKCMTFPALEHIHISALCPEEDIAHILCGSQRLTSLVTNLFPSSELEVHIWDTHSKVSALQEVTVAMGPIYGQNWSMLQFAREYHRIKCGDSKLCSEHEEVLCLGEAQLAVHKIFGGLLKRECFPYLRKINVVVGFPCTFVFHSAWSVVHELVERVFACLHCDEIVVSATVDASSI